jgi:hypothetical protein
MTYDVVGDIVGHDTRCRTSHRYFTMSQVGKNQYAVRRCGSRARHVGCANWARRLSLPARSDTGRAVGGRGGEREGNFKLKLWQREWLQPGCDLSPHGGVEFVEYRVQPAGRGMRLGWGWGKSPGQCCASAPAIRWAPGSGPSGLTRILAPQGRWHRACGQASVRQLAAGRALHGPALDSTRVGAVGALRVGVGGSGGGSPVAARVAEEAGFERGVRAAGAALAGLEFANGGGGRHASVERDGRGEGDAAGERGAA